MYEKRAKMMKFQTLGGGARTVTERIVKMVGDEKSLRPRFLGRPEIRWRGSL